MEARSRVSAFVRFERPAAFHAPSREGLRPSNQQPFGSVVELRVKPSSVAISSKVSSQVFPAPGKDNVLAAQPQPELGVRWTASRAAGALAKMRISSGLGTDDDESAGFSSPLESPWGFDRRTTRPQFTSSLAASSTSDRIARPQCRLSVSSGVKLIRARLGSRGRPVLARTKPRGNNTRWIRCPASARGTARTARRCTSTRVLNKHDKTGSSDEAKYGVATFAVDS